MKARLIVSIMVMIAGVMLVVTFGCGQMGAPGGAQAEPPGKEIALPPPVTSGGMSLAEAISKRRSVREFKPEPLSLAQISQLLWAGQGITEPASGRRAAPSAGAKYPLELYLLSKDGVFHYVPQGHKLIQLGDKDRREDLSNAALGQTSVAQAPLDIVITGVFARTEEKYGERARQYVFMEAGHVAENIVLQGVALGLGSVTAGAFRDPAVSDVLELPADQTPIYIIPVGKAA
jgi:SagB-type dehydrogenase family enzyme